MNTNKMYCYLVCFFALFLLAVPALSSAVEMEILSRVDLSTERRHAWNPWVTYNSDKDEFFVIWNSTGKLRDDCDSSDDYECTKSFQSIEAARVAPNGEILAKLNIVTPKGPKDDVSWMALPRVAYNPVNKEYMGLYTLSTDTCVQCHERNVETGEVYPAEVSRCILCHPGDGPGLCNLVNFMADKGADCLTCHGGCAEGTSPTPPNEHPANCMECHVVDGSKGIHFRPGHMVWDINLFTTKIDGDGNVVGQAKKLYDTPAASGHPVITANTERGEYLIVTNDRFHSDEYENVGFVVDKDANVLNGPLFIGEGSGDWTHVLYYGAYNPIDDTYFVPWEDFRHATGAWYFGPLDIYAALLDSDGNTLRNIPVIEDQAEGEYEQWYPCVVHNPDKNEFFVAWFDERPSVVVDGGICGRIFNADGTPKGEPFVVADTNGNQGDVAIAYAPKHKSYFVVWQSTQNFVPAPDDPPWYFENDIYGRWLDENGQPTGDEIPIFVGEGDQLLPQIAYSTQSDKFFITWWDTYAPQDFEPLPGETGQFAEISSIVMGLLGKGNTYGVIYGTPNPCAARELYGEDSQEVQLLRSFRDSLLNKTPEGRELIKLYYRLSPAIVDEIKENAAFKQTVKEMVDGLLPLIK